MAALDSITDNGNSNTENKIVNINELYSRIIRKHISELLKIIHSKYPTKFPKTAITAELENIFSNVNFINQAITVNESQKNKSNQSKLFTKTSRLAKPKLDPACRCQARIWDDIFDRETCKQVSAVDDEFQVSDYNDINIKRFTKKYILGKQCARKRTTDTNYCVLHNRHRPHGNYLEPPTKELCLHFMIDGGYIDTPLSDDE